MIPLVITGCGNDNTWNLKSDKNFDLYENERKYDFYFDNYKPLIILTNCEDISDIDDIIVNLFMKTFNETKWIWIRLKSLYTPINRIIFETYKRNLQVRYFLVDKFIQYDVENSYEKFKNTFLTKYENTDFQNNDKFDHIIDALRILIKL